MLQICTVLILPSRAVLLVSTSAEVGRPPTSFLLLSVSQTLRRSSSVFLRGLLEIAEHSKKPEKMVNCEQTLRDVAAILFPASSFLLQSLSSRPRQRKPRMPVLPKW